MDGREATVRVRDYFLAANGELGVNLFKVREVGFSEKDRAWIVRCSFFATPHLSREYVYEVLVQESGDIAKVKELTKAG